MRLTKEEMVSEIVVMSETLKSHLEDLKVREGHLDIPDEIIDLKVHDIREGLEWLRGICKNEYAALMRAKRLLTPEQWKQYELFGIEDFENHQEVILLRKAQVELRKTLVNLNRPNLFKKGYIDKQLSAKKQRQDNE